jgi:hypothetical protein
MGYFLFLLFPLLPFLLLALHPSPALKAKLVWAIGMALWIFAAFIASGAIAHHRPEGLTPAQLESWLVSTGLFMYILACVGAWLAFFLFKWANPANKSFEGTPNGPP